ncbi:MAG: T9SS type A sorting domain-containing protein [Cyclobacteriaceae bacterium]|nr:T9SS type A sorting domain-containing protein [Cyclobacteriaceae bacterium]
MKTLYRIFGILLIIVFFSISEVFSQYTKPFPNSKPPWGQFGEWGYTSTGTNWDTRPYLSFIYKDLPFRIMPPKGVTYSNGQWVNSDPGKRYPLYLFLHGLGETGESQPYIHPVFGEISNNNKQLLHGGQMFRDKVNNGTFDGFLLYPQTLNGFFADANNINIQEIIKKLISDVYVDENRIIVNGLSAGGVGVWNITRDYPKLFAGAIPMSGVNTENVNDIPKLVHIPFWLAQGGKDSRPTAQTAQVVVNAFNNAGGYLRYFLYPDLGHGTWNTLWAEPDFFPFINSLHKNNPMVFFQRNEFCTGDIVSVKLGFTAGFDGYEWRRNGQVIAGANSNELTVTQLGTYEGRFRRGSVWTDWSPNPIVVKIKDATTTPPISIAGLASNVLPSPDGKTTVVLELPDGFETYRWKKVGNDEIIGNAKTISVGDVGGYIATVTEKFGCSSSWSDPMFVIPNNGTNKPDAAADLVGFAPNKTQIQLYWVDNPNSQYNETGFEIYRSELSGSNYVLVGKIAKDLTSFLDSDLVPGKNYFYVVRSVNATSAGSLSNEASVVTQIDKSAPTAPLNLQLLSSSRNSVSLSWLASSDDVGVYKYEIYKNGQKVIVTSNTNASVFGLVEGNVYNFTVKAKDVAGNLSPASNQVTAMAANNGLSYKYYHGSWNLIPDFNALSPVKVGTTETFNLDERTQNDNFGFMFEGNINIPTSGNYIFYLKSDDGSKLYIDGTLLVNYDGLHGAGEKSGSRTLTAGSHQIRVDYFEKTSGQALEVRWQGPGISKQIIPASALKDEVVLPGAAPSVPTNLMASPISYNQINLTWADNSNNETAFQIYRAENSAGPFYPIALTDSNATNYQDKELKALTKYYYRVMAIGKYGESGFSDEINQGLEYAYYEINNMSSLPNFNNFVPVETGSIGNFDISVKNRNDNFALVYSGKITIPTSGSYTFYTSSDDGSQLFINDNLIVNNDGLHGTQERSGSLNLNQGTHDIKVTFFERGGGEVLQVRWQGPSIAKQLIPTSVLKDEDINATTLSLPPGPIPPSNLVAVANSSNSIILNWDDNSDNEDYFEIYRSISDANNFILLTTIDGQDEANIEFIDNGLFTNVAYHYYVKAVNVGGSVESNQSFATTLNNAPVLSDIVNFSMRFGSTQYVDVFASDPDNESLTFEVTNLPSFGSLSTYGDGTGLITFEPGIEEVGLYENIIVTVRDEHGGMDQTEFSVLVNNNYVPVITPIAGQTLTEGQTLELNVVASDQNNEQITLVGVNLPSFIQLTDNGDGTGVLSVNPTFNDAGSYSISINALDEQNAVASTSFILVINDKKTNRSIFVNFNNGSNAPAPWNNTNRVPQAGNTMNGLLDSDNENSGINMEFVTTWGPDFGGTGNSGVITGNDSGVYPDVVLRTYYFASDLNNKVLTLTGLDPMLSYNFTFMGASGIAGMKNTIYEINGQSDTLNASNNSSETASLSGLTPNAQGELTINVRKTTNSSYGYLNAMVISSYFTDGNAPVAPGGLAGISNEQGTSLTWDDNSTNELGFKVYRSIDDGANYIMIASLAGDVDTYIDSDVIGSTSYKYYVEAYNAIGNATSNVVSVFTVNAAPIVDVSDLIEVAVGQISILDISYSDPDGDNVVLSTNGLPAFGTLVDNQNGTATISFNASSSDKGDYAFDVIATDSYGKFYLKSVDLKVVDNSISSYFVNFNFTFNEGAPWNNFTKSPFAGNRIDNISNNNGIVSTIDVVLVNGFEGANELGMNTGNNSGIYPDNVMQTSYWESSNNTKNISIEGLKQGNLYNLVFFGSRNGGGNRTTDYSVGGTTVSLNASYNTSNTVQINGVSPDAQGKIVVGVKKASGASYAYINAIVIQEYEDSGIPLAPSLLTAQSISKSVINLNWLDNSVGEQGFELWRSEGENGSFVLIQTLGENVKSYSDAGLTANTTYSYKVRAIADDANSDFSEIVTVGTYAYSILINFNDISGGPYPWNNILAGSFFLNDSRSNLINDIGNNTGISLTLVDEFEGENPWGVVTGNNSGVVPDAVMEGSYWLDPNSKGQFLISNLDYSFGYNFEFFGSRAGDGNRTTNYIIGEKSVSLNSAFNSTNTVQIGNVYPDQDGQVLVEVATASGSSFGYINAMMIHVFPVSQSNARNIAKLDISNDELNRGINVYPNTFTNHLNVDFLGNSLDTYKVSLVDIQGRMVFAKEVDLKGRDHRNVQLELNSRDLRDGMYMLTITNSKDQREVFKLIRSSK